MARAARRVLIEAGLAESAVSILTGAGRKEIRLIERDGCKYLFEMTWDGPWWRNCEERCWICR